MIRLLLWALTSRETRKTLQMFLHIMAGADASARLERLRIMLADYSQRELNYLSQSPAVPPMEEKALSR